MSERMTLTAVLFVGGESRRMGVDKATLSFDGGPLWRRQLDTLRQLQPETLCISARARPAWCPSDVEVVLDEPPSRGPLSGLAAMLARLRTSHLLALAVDLPNMTGAHLAILQAMARPGCGVVPMSGTLFEPLCAIYPVEAAIEAMRVGADASLQRFVRSLIHNNQVRSYELSTVEQGLYRNLNTPGDMLQSTV